MSAPDVPASPGSSGVPIPSAADGPGASPVAVVWCRQVDNEAESPGYTTVPEEFPGRKETLDVIRIVGNLTVNVADTQDYWTPGGGGALNYYPNLFLFPAFGGRYTCVGRMFLSTEDRPRLGMKTLVLDTAQLLATGEYGAAILRWHATMAGTPRDGGRPPPVPDPNLVAVLGEGFLFHRGSTEPVVVIASDQWTEAMQVVFDMVRQLPASLVSLGAILAFPYFLPQGKTNLHEFAEQLPLGLALMRIPRGEAMGDRHRRRLSSWESVAVTLRDLTDGVPAPVPKGKENVPLVLQYLRDHSEAKLAPIAQRVDLVELPRLPKYLADPERQSGRDRRKEMWRIGTAMESAALLLQRSRGRHVPGSVETAKRAQEYLKARVPSADPSTPAEPAVVAALDDAAVARGGALPSAPSALPPWLQKHAAESALGARSTARPETVPISRSDDPSLLPVTAIGLPPASSAPAPASGRGAAPAGPSASAEPAALSADQREALRTEVERTVLRRVDERLTQLQQTVSLQATGQVETQLAARIDAVTSARIQALQKGVDSTVVETLAPLEERLRERVNALVSELGQRQTAAQTELKSGLETRLGDALKAQTTTFESLGGQLQSRIAEVENRQTQRMTALLASTENRLRDAWVATVAAELDRRLSRALEQQLDDPGKEGPRSPLVARLDAMAESRVRLAVASAAATWTQSLAETEANLTAMVSRSETNSAATHSDLAGTVRAWVDERLTEVGRDAERGLAGVRSQVEERLSDAERRATEQVQAQALITEDRIRKALGLTLASEFDKRVRATIDQQLPELAANAERTLRTEADQLREQLRSELARSLEELRAQLEAAATSVRGDVSTQWTQQVASAVEREAGSRSQFESRIQNSITQRFSDQEARYAQELKAAESRIGLLIDARQREGAQRLATTIQESENRLLPRVTERFGSAEGRLDAKIDTRLKELRELEGQTLADLQVRLQSYSDQKLREAEEHVKATYVELLARLKSEVETSLTKATDPARLEPLVAERLQKVGGELTRENERRVEQRIAAAEERILADQSEAGQRLEILRRQLQEHAQDATGLEDALRAELDEIDRRLIVLSDRLVPVVRKTWLRIAELEKGVATPSESELRYAQIRREIAQEIRRLEAEIAERSREIRDRLETSISSQGKVWLTLVRQLSQLTESRRAWEASRRSAEVDEPDLRDAERGRTRTEGRDADLPDDSESAESLDESADDLDARRVDRTSRLARRRLRRS